MRKYFKGINSKEADGWLLADCGNSGIDGNDYTIDTNSLHADEIPDACTDAKTFSLLVAGLLNCYYNNQVTRGMSEDFIIALGTVDKEIESIPHPSNPKLPF
jgi:hypothetical protein